MQFINAAFVEAFDRVGVGCNVTDNVDTNSWKNNGGDVGEISGDATKKHLVITQTLEAQRKIREVLKALQVAQCPTTKP